MEGERRVEFIGEVIWASLLVGLPVGVFTLALVWWALQRGYLKESTNTNALRLELKAMSGSAKKKKKQTAGDENQKQHPLQKKWAKFGGGFYGIVAFFTYIVIEAREIISTITHLGGFFDFIRQLGFDVIIQMLVQAMLNFVFAMIWPVYWMQRIETARVWVWFLLAYAGYWAGLKLAQELVRRRSKATG
jgi:hypothetical protein